MPVRPFRGSPRRVPSTSIVMTAALWIAACSGESFHAVDGEPGSGGAAGTVGAAAGSAGTEPNAGAGGAGQTQAGGSGEGGASAGSAGQAGGSAGAGGADAGASGSDAAGAGAGGITAGGSGGGGGTSAGAAGAGAGAAGQSGGGATGTAGAGGSGQGGAAGQSGGGAGGGGGVAGAGAGAGAGGGNGCLDTSACSAGHYCKQSTGTCTSCADLSALELATPQAINGDSSTESYRGLYFPRVVFYDTLGGTFALFYRGDTQGLDGDLGFLRASNDTFSSLVGYGLPAPISVPKTHDSGPSPLPMGVTGARFVGGSGDFGDTSYVYVLFDSDRGATSGTFSAPARRLYLGRAPSLSDPNAKVAEVIGTNVTAAEVGDDFSPTYAPGNNRLYWDRRREVGESTILNVMTRQFAEGPVLGGPVSAAVPIPMPECGNPFVPVPNAAFNTWVTPDGHWLFFQQTCFISGDPQSARARMYRVALDPKTGQVAAGESAELVVVPPLDGAQTAARLQRGASLSPDQCTMYLELDNQLYYARRR